MAKRQFRAGFWLRSGLGLTAAVAMFPMAQGARAQSGVVNLPDIPASVASRTMNVPDAPAPTRSERGRVLPDRLPERPSQAPAFSIPVEPLGFTTPGPIYLGQRTSLASLDFLDEDRLLFTFRVPGLIRRQAEEGEAGYERQIRAVVLSLPAGTVQAEALWTVHDRARYLWMLKEGHFLLRDRDNLERGDATLELKPFLRFPGPVEWLETDPAHEFLVTNSREPKGEGKPGEVASPSTAAADLTVEGQTRAEEPAIALRILRGDTGQVMLMSHTYSTVHLPINSDGYLESLRGKGNRWLLNLNYFSGGSTILGRLESACSPRLEFVSDREVLATGCLEGGAEKLEAIASNGRRLWEAETTGESVWPLLVRSPDGSRLAREALAVGRPVTARTPLDASDIKGQLVQILNAADGNVVLDTAASPVLDAGGNVAISPSGRRVAVVNAGAIQVFELPAPPVLSDAVRQPVQ